MGKLFIRGVFICQLLLIIELCACTESPQKVEVKRLLHLNQTSLVIALPLHTLHDTLLHLFSANGGQIDNPILMRVFDYRFMENDPNVHQVYFLAEASTKPVFSCKYFQKMGTKNDIYLTSMGEYWYSRIYFSNGRPFKYISPYVLALESKGTDSTLLKVVAETPTIFNGTLCCGPHGDYARLDTVKATSVEEYTLILYVANELGLKGLTPLHIPE